MNDHIRTIYNRRQSRKTNDLKVGTRKLRTAKSTRPGFSLIELLAALLISSLIGICLMGVTGRFSSQWDSVRTDFETLQYQQSLRSLLAFDLKNSRSLQFTGSQLRLTGFSSQSETGNPTMQLSGISYELSPVQGRMILVRRCQTVRHPNTAKQHLTSNITGLDVLQPSKQNPGKWKSLIWDRDRDKRIQIPPVIRIQFYNDRDLLFDEIFIGGAEG